MPTCPHCRAELSAGDVQREVCSTCGKAIPHSAETIPVAGPGAGVPTVGAEALPETETVERIEDLWAETITDGMTPGMTLKKETGRAETPGGITVKRHKVVDEGDEADPAADFELLRVLGEGGMGVVYEARQTAIGRSIALKMIKGAAAVDGAHRAKFLSEAAVTGELDHPNIVPIYDLGANDRGHLFYAMKHVQGTPWDEVLGEKTQSENLELLLRVADAVAFAHSRGVIHRDLKPENVMLGDYGEVLLTDWGLAAASASPEAEASAAAEALSAETAVGGTPAYMAPEMAEGDPARIGPQSDIYLLGGMLYEIVTGLKPHTGNGVMGCLLSAAENIIQPTDKRGELIDIALKAMATDPSDRHRDVKAFQDAIRQYQAHSESNLLAGKAHEDLARAQKTQEYDDYAQAVFGYRQALELWAENSDAREGVTTARLAYARCACEKGDLDLAAGLLDESVPDHRELLAEVNAAQAERVKRRRRLKALTWASAAAALIIVAGSVVAALWIGAEQKKTKAALAQVTEEQEKTKAERDRAIEAEAAAKDALRKAQQESYYNAIALADSKIREHSFRQAQSLLASCPEQYRNWEWGRLMRLCHLELVTLKGHANYVFSVAFSPEGARIVTGSGDKTARVWDAESGRELLTLKGHAGPVSSVAFSPDGTRIITGSGDKTARVWPALDWTKSIKELEAAKLERWKARWKKTEDDDPETTP
jgi:hypothetical protein